MDTLYLYPVSSTGQVPQSSPRNAPPDLRSHFRYLRMSKERFDCLLFSHFQSPERIVSSPKRHKKEPSDWLNCHRKIGPGNNGPRTKIFAENIGPPDHFFLKKLVRLENIGPTPVIM